MTEGDYFNILDTSKIGSFQKRLIVLASLGPFSDAFNEFGVSVSLVTVGILFHLSAIFVAMLVASYWVGVAFGGILGGVVSDLVGRRTLFVYDTLGMAVFALLSAISFNGTIYFVTRFLLGLFIGLDYAAAVPLVSEYSPAKIRGKILSIEKVFFKLGGLTTIALSFILTLTTSKFLAWRIDFIAAAIVPLILFFLRKDIPESIRWAADTNNHKLISSINGKLKKFGLEINEKLLPAGEVHTVRGNLKEFFSKKNSRVVFYIFWLATGYALTVNIASVYGTAVFTQLGASGSLALECTLITAFAGLFGILLMLFIVDRVGRRITGTLGFLLTAVPSVIFVVAYITGTMSLTIAVIAIALIFFINVGLVGTLMYIPSVELTPTHIRGLTIGWDKLFAFGMAFPALTLYAALGLKDAFLFVTVASIIFGIGTYFVTIDVTGKTLEEAEASVKKKEYKVKSMRSM
ncbi:MAG: MFS transporter [Thermoplasmatales archaeon]